MTFNKKITNTSNIFSSNCHITCDDRSKQELFVPGWCWHERINQSMNKESYRSINQCAPPHLRRGRCVSLSVKYQVHDTLLRVFLLCVCETQATRAEEVCGFSVQS